MSGLFGHGGATSVYLVLYLVTWVIHMVLAGAVAGGAVVVTADALLGGPATRPRRAIAALLRGDLPLLLGLAITAGVAPLLFVQILYREAFYTASLLANLRFLAVLPALLGCFYLLYLGKTERGRRARPLIYGGAAAMALFIGYSFAELHALAIEPSIWVEHYRRGRAFHADVAVVIRHLAFAGVAGASTGLVGLWSARWRSSESAAALAPIAIVGLGVAVISAAIYGRLDGSGVTPPVGHMIAAGAGAIVAAMAWAVIGTRRRAAGIPLALATAGTVMFLWGLAIAREAVRAARLDLGALAGRHAAVAEHGGDWLFVALVLINGAGVAWCITRAWRARAKTPPPPGSG